MHCLEETWASKAGSLELMGLEECLKQANRVCTRRSGQGCLGRLRKHLLEDLCTTCFFAVCFITRHFGHSICNFHIPKLRKQINTRNEHGAKKHFCQDADCNRVICDNIATSTPVEVRLSQSLRILMFLPCRSS